LALLAISIFTW